MLESTNEKSRSDGSFLWGSYRCERIGTGIKISEYMPEEEEDSLCIPSRIEGEPVVEIGASAFSENGALLSRIEIPPTVRHIGEGAFRMCMNLTELVLHEGLETIGEGALFLTPVTELTLPDTVSEVDAPWELGSIRFFISEKNKYYATDGFCLYRTEDEGRTLLVSRQGDERESYDIPEGTSSIGESAFSGNGTLRRVTIPGTVRLIGEAAFEGCENLSEVTLCDGVSEIRENAFAHCIQLKSIHLPSSLRSIGEYALSDTFGWSEQFLGLTCITVDPGNENFTADEECLYEAGESGQRYIVKYFGEKGEYRIPEDISRILPGAFRRAKFYRCEIPETVHSVGTDAFRECRNLEEVLLKESGTLLYIPRQPLYRKDEVTALFLGERPEGGYIYDYPGYDALFDTYLNLPDQCGMACCRLKYPTQLSEETEQIYWDFLQDNLNGILKGIADRQDMDRLVMLAGLGLFTGENIDEALEVFSRAGRTKFTGYLLNYRKEHRTENGFDFTI